MGELLLSLFPGADLLGRAFESSGCSVVRGPDVLLGGDVREWTVPPAGRFDGVIGGPPCQMFSTARNIGGHDARHIDGVPLFWEIVSKVKPQFAVMENVVGVVGHDAIPPSAKPLILKDWDCGGLTSRRRVFYVWPGELVGMIPVPQHRDGKPEFTVLSSSHKTGQKRAERSMHARLSASDAGRLQGWPEISETMLEAGNKGRIFPNRFVVHCMGNGVPRAMGEWLAGHLMAAVRGECRGLKLA